MRRMVAAALCAAILATVGAGSVLAAKPTTFIVDVSETESEDEALLLAICGYPIDVENRGHIVVHLFDGHTPLIEIDNYQMFESFSANGKTVVAHPDAGPDVIWVGSDGDVFLALVGRSVTGSGVIGRTVVNLSTGELVSSHGHELGDFIEFLCSELAPPG